MPRYLPVDYDPFNEAPPGADSARIPSGSIPPMSVGEFNNFTPPAGPVPPPPSPVNLVPVDYDPFAQETTPPSQSYGPPSRPETDMNALFSQALQPPDKGAGMMRQLKAGTFGALSDLMTETAGLTEFGAQKIAPFVPGFMKRIPSAAAPAASARNMADALSAVEQSAGYAPTVGMEDVIANPLKAPRFVGENIGMGLPYLAASATPAGVAANLLSISGNVAEERARNKGEEQVSGESAVEALPAGIVSALLNKLGLEKILKPFGKTGLGRVLAAGAGEAATEALQEGGAEYLGGTLGTDKKPTLKEAGTRAAGGALIGGTTGATVRLPIEAYGAATGRTAPAGAGTETDTNIPARPASPPPPPAAPAPVPVVSKVEEKPRIPPAVVQPPEQPVEKPEKIPQIPVEETPAESQPVLPPANTAPAQVGKTTPISPVPAEPSTPPTPIDSRETSEEPVLTPPPEQPAEPPASSASVEEKQDDSQAEDLPAGYHTIDMVDRFKPHQAFVPVKGMESDEGISSQKSVYANAKIITDGHLMIDREGNEDMIPAGKVTQPSADKARRFTEVLDLVRGYNQPEFTFEPVAAYDSALLGQRPGEVVDDRQAVYGMLGEKIIAVPPRAYDVLIRQKGYEIRGKTADHPLGIYKGDQLIGAIMPYGKDKYHSDEVDAAIKALRGRITPEQARQNKPGKPLTVAVKPTATGKGMTAGQRGAAAQTKEEFINRLKEIRARAAAAVEEGEDDYNGGKPEQVTLKTASGRETKYKITSGSREAVKTIDNLIAEFKGKRAEVFASRNPARGGAEKSSAPDPVAEKQGGEFYQRLISLRRGIWKAAGIDYRIGENMPPGKQFEVFKKVFDEKFDLNIEALKDADFASALNNLKDYYVEIQAMASILRMPVKAVGLRLGDGKAKRLSVVFTKDGNQGWSGLFSPSDKTIVIPGRARSFAHEFFHALDFRLLDIMGPAKDSLGRHFSGYTGRVRREGLNYEPQSVEEAMVNLMDAMFFDDAFAASRILALEQQLSHTRTDKRKDEIRQQIENVKRGKDRAFKFRSEYYKNAARKDKAGDLSEDKGYWAMPAEMLARAGEAYVAHRAEAAMVDIKSITKDADVYEGSARWLADRYPHEGDRFRIFTALDRLLDQVAQRGMLSGDVPAEEAMFPNDNESADPVRWFRQQDGYEKPKKTIKEIIIGTPEERAELRRAAMHIMGLDKNRPFNGITVGRYIRDVQMAYGVAISRHLKVIASRYDSPTLDRLVEKITRKGDRYDVVEKEFYNKYSARLGRIIEATNLSRLDDEQMGVLNDLLLGWRQDVPKKYNEKNMLDAAAGIREVLDEMVMVLREDYGVDVGYIKDMDTHYLPSVPDRAWTMMNRKKAIEEYAAAYRRKFEEDIAAIKAGTIEPSEARFDPDSVDIEEMADAAAEALVDEINLGEVLNHGVTGAPGGFTKRRTFSGAAQRELKNSRIHNPIDLMEFYVSAASRKAAWTKTFDPEDGAYTRDIKQLQKEGVSVIDTKVVDHLIRSATRRERNSNAVFHASVSFLEGLKILLSMSMLARVQVLALFEPVVVGLRTRNVINSFRGFYDVVNENLLRADASDRRRIMEAFGIMPNEHASMILLDREGGTFGNTPKLSRAASEVFMATQTTRITEATRRGNVASGERYFYAMAADAKQGKNEKKRKAAREELVYSGVPENRLDEMVDYIIGLEITLPTIDHVSSDFSHPSRIYARMLQEFISDSTQDPKPSDRSWAMNTALGGILFAYPGFQMRIYEHIFKRNRDVMLKKYKEDGAIDGTKELFAGIVAPWAIYYAAQCAAYMLKTIFFNRAAWEEKDDDEKIKMIMAGGLAYSIPLGFYGDLAYQFWSGTKYSADINRMFVGKLGYLFSAMDDALKIIPNNYRANSSNNNKQERSAAEGLYRAIALPAMGFGLAALPAPPAIKGAAGLGYAWMGSPDAQKSMSMGLIGETEKEKKARESAERKKEREKESQ